MPNLSEYFVGTYHAVKMNKFLKAYATKADKWCFIRFELEPRSGDVFDINTKNNKLFFFECALNIEGKAFWREMNENCPYPPIKPISPVVEELCFMHAKKSADFIDHALDAYGEGNSEGIVHCYVKVLTETKKGDVETMCSKNAIVDGWEALT